MPTFHTLVAFTVVSVGLMLVPGPSNLFLLAHGIAHGRASALTATAGIAVASAVRVLLAAAGLSAVLASSAIAFNAVRWAGVAYLTYLGVRALTARGDRPDQPAPRITRLHSARKGLMVGLGNPKMMMFYLALLPQFVHRGRGPEALQVLVLGALLWGIGTIWDLAFACASATVSRRFRSRRSGGRAGSRVEGTTYLTLAGWGALSGTRPHA